VLAAVRYAGGNGAWGAPPASRQCSEGQPAEVGEIPDDEECSEWQQRLVRVGAAVRGGTQVGAGCSGWCFRKARQVRRGCGGDVGM
jgi:hypothetical protein